MLLGHADCELDGFERRAGAGDLDQLLRDDRDAGGQVLRFQPEPRAGRGDVVEIDGPLPGRVDRDGVGRGMIVGAGRMGRPPRQHEWQNRGARRLQAASGRETWPSRAFFPGA